MRELLERIEGLFEAAASTMDAEKFAKALMTNTTVYPGYITVDPYNRFSDSYDQVLVTYYGVPSEASTVDKMNNRAIWEVKGFSRELGKGPPSGKVKLETVSMSPRLGQKTRAKTSTPELMVKYLAGELSKIREGQQKAVEPMRAR